MNVTITGIGLWTRGLYGWDDFLCAMRGDFAALGGELAMPKPEAIPPRERRRAGLTINLAVEVTHQACAMAGVDPAAAASVFASAMGDTDITDYMCRKLATAEKLLSPTQFHNSVHNAASGYWSISAANRLPSGFVSGFRDSFAIGLLEAATLAAAERVPVVLTAYDIANRAPFGDVLPVSETLGLALVVMPGEHVPAGHGPGSRMSLALSAGASTAPVPKRDALRRLADANPIGAGLPLLEVIAEGAAADLEWPVGSGVALRARVTPRRRCG